MSRKGRDPIDRELQAWRERLDVVNRGLLACYETIAEGNRQKADLEAKIAQRTLSTPPGDAQNSASGEK